MVPLDPDGHPSELDVGDLGVNDRHIARPDGVGREPCGAKEWLFVARKSEGHATPLNGAVHLDDKILLLIQGRNHVQAPVEVPGNGLCSAKVILHVPLKEREGYARGVHL